MDVKVAAKNTMQFIQRASRIPDSHDEYGKDHLVGMVEKISSGEVSGEKAHRWLGWLQACVCIGGGATLEELKKINHEA